MLNLLFNTLLTMTPHNTQRKNNVWILRRCSRWVTHPVRNPDRQGLTSVPGGAKVQVTGHRLQVTGYRSQATGQVTGHRSQATDQVTGHTKNNRTLDKTVLD